jgi:hypothetical protein
MPIDPIILLHKSAVDIPSLEDFIPLPHHTFFIEQFDTLRHQLHTSMLRDMRRRRHLHRMARLAQRLGSTDIELLFPVAEFDEHTVMLARLAERWAIWLVFSEKLDAVSHHNCSVPGRDFVHMVVGALSSGAPVWSVADLRAGVLEEGDVGAAEIRGLGGEGGL